MVNIGIISPSEIAVRRFLPALASMPEDLTFIGIGHSLSRPLQLEKAEAVVRQYGGRLFDSYEAVVCSEETDAIYLPLPPALHAEWASMALEKGKHVLVEKPCTISLQDTVRLVSQARSHHLALHENYMFRFHRQIRAIDDLIADGEIGEVRLFRISFGFPRRAVTDFRYNRELGGGALIDAGGYVLRYADHLLGRNARVVYAQLNHTADFDVDIYGSAALVNPAGVTAQVAFGMDNEYRCELEVWGSRGLLKTGRVLTAPPGFEPSVMIRKGNDETVIPLPADDAFQRSIFYFLQCIQDPVTREESYQGILRQAELVDQVLAISSNHSVT